MWCANEWKDYAVLDTKDGEKLERWGDVLLVRPDPQIVWGAKKPSPLWQNADAHYHRSNKGGGAWDYFKKLPEKWVVSYKNLKFYIKPMGFKHTGLFTEQAVNWDFIISALSGRKNAKMLNLFGYTGAATVAGAFAGAAVTHVDASKNMVSWCKENMALSGLADRPVRYLVDDCMKFVQREIRRGNKYDAIIMDPPSYGRGPGGEVWKMEDSLYEFVGLTARLLSDDPAFFIINSYTTGLAPTVIANILTLTLGGKAEAQEIGLPVSQQGIVLPCGATGRWIK